MLADMLLEAGRPQEALAQYEIALKTDPNRFNGLYGAAQAATQLQQKDKAAAYYRPAAEELRRHPLRPPRADEARTLVAAR